MAVGIAPVGVPSRLARVELDGLGVVGDGGVPVAALGVAVAAVEEGRRVARLQPAATSSELTIQPARICPVTWSSSTTTL